MARSTTPYTPHPMHEYQNKGLTKLTIRKCMKTKGRRDHAKGCASEFHNGKSWYTPGSFYKSGKYRTYAIRKIKECATGTNERGYKCMFCIRKSTPAQGRETKESGPFAKPPDLECSSGVRCLGEERLQSKKKRQPGCRAPQKAGRISVRILHGRWEIVKENYSITYNLLNQC
jgi:hypothetical protein